MNYNKKELFRALEESFKAYQEKGPRSTAKLLPIHKYFADTLIGIFGKGYEIFYLGDKSKNDKTNEKIVMGKYYPKTIDITIVKNDCPVFCFGIKFVTSNYKQNANNYFEGMIGETANIQALGNLPYAHLIILRQPTPYFEKGRKIPSRWEIINDHHIKKYSELVFENPQAHRPLCMAVPIFCIDENTKKFSFAKLNAFSKGTKEILNTKLSIDNAFNEIKAYATYLRTKK